MAKTSRKEVYLALDSERAYQATRWNRDTTATGGVHESLADWLLYMRKYIEKAENHLAFEGEPEATQNALQQLRKVTALGVAAMEALGSPQREGYEQHFVSTPESPAGPGLSSYHSKHGK